MTTNDNTPRHGLGAQLWGAMKGALVDEDPIAATRRAKLQDSHATAATSETTGAPAATMSPTWMRLNTWRGRSTRCALPVAIRSNIERPGP